MINKLETILLVLLIASKLSVAHDNDWFDYFYDILDSFTGDYDSNEKVGQTNVTCTNCNVTVECINCTIADRNSLMVQPPSPTINPTPSPSMGGMSSIEKPNSTIGVQPVPSMDGIKPNPNLTPATAVKPPPGTSMDTMNSSPTADQPTTNTNATEAIKR